MGDLISQASGQCQCGAVRFELALPSKWLAHCHCNMCRHAHGAGYVTWLGMAAERCQIQDPEQQLRWYASSPEAERGFCARCGSPLFFRSSRWAGELHIAFAQIRDAVDRQPQAHVFWDSHVAWATPADDGLPRKGAV
ncbi:GFA family protein [Pseudomarimonas arenosa]|uniref:GFA family protein n=1 Tax=Pseudomarimonas arenosa TaxID=2774145 RepID=A0AAW3ZHQ4_9GAMM|nr:GFA family protein [Pseudomarimonas arenosa]MBD8524522.1 GFA family protein [Pseudomarimonas arenosa]